MPVILIVEDDAAIVHALTEYLASEGFGAQAAAGEREALACYYPVSGDGEALWGEEPLRCPLRRRRLTGPMPSADIFGSRFLAFRP